MATPPLPGCFGIESTNQIVTRYLLVVSVFESDSKKSPKSQNVSEHCASFGTKKQLASHLNTYLTADSILLGGPIEGDGAQTSFTRGEEVFVLAHCSRFLSFLTTRILVQ